MTVSPTANVPVPHPALPVLELQTHGSVLSVGETVILLTRPSPSVLKHSNSLADG